MTQWLLVVVCLLLQSAQSAWVPTMRHEPHHPTTYLRQAHEASTETPIARWMRSAWKEQATFAAANTIVHYYVKSNQSNISPFVEAKLSNQNEYGTLFDAVYSGHHQSMPSSLPCTGMEQAMHQSRTITLRLNLAYHGSAFCGWQRQASHPLPSVQQMVEDALTHAFAVATHKENDDKENNNEETVEGSQQQQRHRRMSKQLQQRVDIRVVGRTDAGVHAIGQVARVRLIDDNNNFTTLTTRVQAILDQAAQTSGGTWRCWRVTPMPHSFHPTFQATSRSYVYLIDATTLQALSPNSTQITPSPQDIAQTLTTMLQALEHETLDYYALSSGQLHSTNTTCTLTHARARWIPSLAAVAVELTADRFLRHMVRILVQTCLVVWLESLHAPTSNVSGATQLLTILHSRDRRASAPPAPAQGLLLVGATFS
jgi:tRNA pseudouridine38-40 synthase